MLPAGSSKVLQRHSVLAAGVLGRRWVAQLLGTASLEGRGGTWSLQTVAPGKGILLPARRIALSGGGVHSWE